MRPDPRPVLTPAALADAGCVRLPLRVDAVRLRAEIDALAAEVWTSRAERIGVHRDAGAVFLRGRAPAEGDLPIQDREVLGRLPYTRRLIWETFRAPPQRCLLARLEGGGIIPEHRDLGPYFARTVRLHIPVISHEEVFMLCGGLSYQMAPGEVWRLDNGARHGVWNADADRPRTHLICDFTPSPALQEMLEGAEAGLGRRNERVAGAIRAEGERRAALRAGAGPG